MKAVVQTRYGAPADVLRVREVEEPTVGDDEVLVRVRAASVHPDVRHVVTGRPYVLRLMGSGFVRPKNPVPGTDSAGEVVKTGRNVSDLRAGDAVFGESLRGFQWVNAGAFAEYASVPRKNLARKPAHVTFEQAATLPTAGFIAVLNLRGHELGAGKHVLVNGAGGGVGSIVLQLAKASAATVTGVDGAKKLELLRTLGADSVIDYTQGELSDGAGRFDLIVDVASTLTFSRARRLLRPGGKYVLIGHDHFGGRGGRVFGSISRFVGLALLMPFVNELPKLDFSTPERAETMNLLRERLESGKLTSVVAQSFPLDAVPEAIRFLAQGEPVGRIVVTP